MDILLLLLRLMLAIVFAAAGTAKLWDRAGSRKSVADFGAPAWLAGPIGTTLPFAELGAAALLVPARTAFWGAAAALILLAVFIAAIAANLARGRTPDCRCFGQVQVRPIGWATLVRNGVLALVAALVVWTTGASAAPSIAAVFGVMTRTQSIVAIGAAAMIAALATQGWVVLQLFRQQGRLLLRIEALEGQLGSSRPAEMMLPAGPPPGAPAPPFDLRSLSGARVTLETFLGNGSRMLLIFTDPDCGHCGTLLPDVARWQREGAGGTRIVLVSSGTEEAVRRQAEEHGIRDVLLEENSDVATAYGAHWFPAGVLISPDGVIGSRLAFGPEPIAELLAGTEKSLAPDDRSVVTSAGSPSKPASN